MRRLTIADAKQRLGIPELWRHFGFEGQPKTSCRCPWREDHKASFSVNAAGDLYHDFATGEGGDAVDFFQRATGLSKKEACRKFIELAGGTLSTTPRAPRVPNRPEVRAIPRFPEFRRGKTSDHAKLAELRQLSRDGLQLAEERGLLWFARLYGCDAWIVTDSRRLHAQARRLDGLDWDHIQAKAYTLPGSWAGWPIGANAIQPFQTIAFCEGGPDLLAACHFIAGQSRQAECAPVAMMGASQRIHEQVLPRFAGKRIRIFAHTDTEGGRAAVRWEWQLETAGAEVDAFNFAGLRRTGGEEVEDLNDATTICPENASNLLHLFP